MVKNLPANASDVRDWGLIPESGRSPVKGNGNPFHYSCLGNSTDRGAWLTTVRRVAESWTQLKQFSTYVHVHTYVHTHTHTNLKDTTAKVSEILRDSL